MTANSLKSMRTFSDPIPPRGLVPPRTRSTRGRSALGSLATFVLLFSSASAAWAEDLDKPEETQQEGPATTTAESPLSMDPSAPGWAPIPGGTTASLTGSTSEGDWRFGFHGFFTMPLVLGLNSREDPEPGQAKTTIHTPPVIPGDMETFSYTGVTPLPYAQMNISYGNNIITANMQIVARQASVSMGFFDPPSQAGINDAYFTIRPNLGSKKFDLKMHFGAFSTRYGLAGEYDQGRYGTPLLFRTNGVGENIIAMLRVSDSVVLMAEQGFQGQSNKAPSDLVPDLWNGFADANQGSSFVNHMHLGVNIARMVTLGLHYGSAFSRDDRATGTLEPDGTINVIGGDMRFSMGRFGHLYLSGSDVRAHYAATVGRIIEIFNAPGGGGLMENYLGDQSRGNGELVTFGGQYDLSIGRLVSYPVAFYGDGPDIVVSVFGAGIHVNSDDDRADNVWKTKFGAEATYSFLPWMAAGARFDQVHPNMSDTRWSYAAISPRLIFRTDWQSQDQLTLQYSYFIHGSQTTTRTGAPPKVDPTVNPDNHVVSLAASMWW